MLQSETTRKYDTYKDSGIEWIDDITQKNTAQILKIFVMYKGGNIV